MAKLAHCSALSIKHFFLQTSPCVTLLSLKVAYNV